MNRKGPRLALDLLLSAMLVFEMLYTLTGNMLHELMGALFFLTLIVHIVLSRRWFGGVRAKRNAGRALTAKQKAKLIISILLAAVGLILLVSSVLISNVLGSLTGWQLGFDAYNWWAYAHTIGAYALCALAVCHVGLHWIGVFKALRIPYNAERRHAINVGVTAVAAVGVVALGSAATKALEVLPMDMTAQEEAGSHKKATEGNGNAGEQNQQRNRGEGPAERNGLGEGKQYGKRYGNSSANTDEQDSSSSAIPEGNSPRSPFGNGSTESDSSSSSVCTLCHKQCSLSAPRCNKPYAAGLL